MRANETVNFKMRIQSTQIFLSTRLNTKMKRNEKKVNFR